jgi:hypothetical protein
VNPILFATLGQSALPGKVRLLNITHKSTQTAERRRAKRYRMNTAAIFHWMGPEGKRFQGEGATRDMSVDSVFVVTATCPPASAAVQLEVILPLSDGASKAQMKSDMKVLRVDNDLAGNTRSGFSAVGKGFMLCTSSERASRVVAGLMKEAGDAIEEEE